MKLKSKILVMMGAAILIGSVSIDESYARKKKKDVLDLSEISKKVETVETTVTTHGKSIATMTTQVGEVVSKFQSMNGSIGANEKKNENQDKLLGDVQTRLQTTEDKISLLVSQLQELRSEGLMKPQASKRFDEYKAYAISLEHINAGSYNKAIESLKNFQKKHKKSIFQSYAQFWIAESYYLQNDYPMSIKQYQKLLSKNPRSGKAPLALLRQGLAFYHMQMFEDSKTFFAKVAKSYPRTMEAVQAKANMRRIDKILRLKKQQELEMKMVN